MSISADEAADILLQIQQNRWKWLGVKRFVPEGYTDIGERYAAFEKHHMEETIRMLEVIKGLCETVVSGGRDLK